MDASDRKGRFPGHLRAVGGLRVTGLALLLARYDGYQPFLRAAADAHAKQQQVRTIRSPLDRRNALRTLNHSFAARWNLHHIAVLRENDYAAVDAAIAQTGTAWTSMCAGSSGGSVPNPTTLGTGSRSRCTWAFLTVAQRSAPSCAGRRRCWTCVCPPSGVGARVGPGLHTVARRAIRRSGYVVAGAGIPGACRRHTTTARAVRPRGARASSATATPIRRPSSPTRKIGARIPATSVAPWPASWGRWAGCRT